MAAISSVFTIARVAEMLGEDEDLLHEVSLDMEPEDGVLWIYGVRGEEVLAFLPSASKTCATSSPSTKNPPLGLERPVTEDGLGRRDQFLEMPVSAGLCHLILPVFPVSCDGVMYRLIRSGMSPRPCGSAPS